MRVILVVGPSGAGKDTLLRVARERFSGVSDLGFAKRYVTRPPDGNEDNYYVDENGFEVLEKESFFISTWRAHGNYYGIPYHEVKPNGQRSTIASISRSAITDFHTSPLNPITVLITARPEVLQQRLAARGRESTEDIMVRLQRSEKLLQGSDHITFDNSAGLEQTAREFIALMDRLHNS